jgi:Arc/MetJ family transcription regulator
MFVHHSSNIFVCLTRSVFPEHDPYVCGNWEVDTLDERYGMRTNVAIHGQLIADTQQRTGIKTKRAVVEEALRPVVRIKRQEEIQAWRGKLARTGDLEATRTHKES